MPVGYVLSPWHITMPLSEAYGIAYALSVSISLSLSLFLFLFHSSLSLYRNLIFQLLNLTQISLITVDEGCRCSTL